jgi:hypothetical protein
MAKKHVTGLFTKQAVFTYFKMFLYIIPGLSHPGYHFQSEVFSDSVYHGRMNYKDTEP